MIYHFRIACFPKFFPMKQLDCVSSTAFKAVRNDIPSGIKYLGIVYYVQLRNHFANKPELHSEIQHFLEKFFIEKNHKSRGIRDIQEMKSLVTQISYITSGCKRRKPYF